MVDGVRFHLVTYLAGGFERFGQVGEDLVHLRPRLEPFLLGVKHTVRVVQVAPCGKADEAVVSFGIFLVHEVAVVRADILHVIFRRQFQDFRVHLHLFRIRVAVGPHVGVRHLVALQFQVVILSEHPFEPPYRFLRLLDAALHDFLRHLAAQASRAYNQSFVELLQVLVVGAWPHIEAVHPAA